jgi:ORF6N domain
MSKGKSLVIPDEVVMNKIYFIREHKVMLDRDLAELYGLKAIRLREQVKRNQERFPENFMFQLTEIEVENMVSQNAIPSKQHLGGSLPYAFTEHGVLMLANVLKSEQAITMSIRIIEIFVKLRAVLLTHKDILLKLEQLEKTAVRQDDDIKLIFEYLKELLNPPTEPMRKIGFKIKGAQ